MSTGGRVSSRNEASFQARRLPADEPLDSVAEQFAAWWLKRGIAEQLAPPDVDFAAELLNARLPDQTRSVLLGQLLESLPFDLTWKAPVLLGTAASSTAALEALRRLALSGPFDARDNVAQWLIEREALGVAELGALLEDFNVRYSAASALERQPARALRPLSAVLTRLAIAEKHAGTRRVLARLARKGRGREGLQGSGRVDAATLTARIQLDWDASPSRKSGKLALEQLAALEGGSGLVALLTLRHGASSRSLREACRSLLETAVAPAALDAALTEELLRLAGAAERKPIEKLVAAHLEQAMVTERWFSSERLKALLGALGPRRTLLVRAATEAEPWFLKEGADTVPGQLQLVHPACLAHEVLRACMARAERDQLVIACEQLTRAVFRVAAHQRSDERIELDLPNPRYPRSLLANGWCPAGSESFDPYERDYAAFSESTKSFASAGVVAHWHHTTVYPKAHELAEPDGAEWLTFFDTSVPPRQLELGQVPPIVFSELLRELTPKAPRAREPRLGRRRARASKAPACVDQICDLVTRLAASPELRADALRLVESLDEPARAVIEVFTTGKARTDAEACALLDLEPPELTSLTERVRQAFVPMLGR